jgi:aminoglycoside phosphotransferase (APT) family kinase protein
MTPERLIEALARLAPFAGSEVGGLQRLSGGASHETWAFTASNGEYVLRLDAGVRSGGSDGRAVSLSTEAALIRAADAAGAPVPALVYVAGGDDGFGDAHITRRVAGETLGRRIAGSPDFDTVRPGLARQCGQILAAIHAAQPPAELAAVDFLGELARYEEAYRGSGAQRPVLDVAIQWLRGSPPPPTGMVLVHGDFRNGNLLVDAQHGVVAVLDWELAHVGDRAEDLGWICVNSWRFGHHERPVGGFGTVADLLAGYVAGGGPDISPETVRAWQALGSLKWGVICLSMYTSFANGEERSVERPMIGRRVSEVESDLLALIGRS